MSRNDGIKQELNARRRARRWRQLRNLFIAGMIVWTGWETWSYIHSPNLEFGTIEIIGSRNLSPADVLRLSDQYPPVNIFNLDAGKIQKALENDVRFRSCDVDYDILKAALRIRVDERMPAVYVQDSYGNFAKVDYAGVVMNVTKGIPDSSAPLLANARLENAFVGDKVTNKDILAVLKFLNGLSFEACEAMLELKVDEYRNLQVVLRQGLKVVVGKLEEADGKASAFLTIFNSLEEKYIDVEYIDLRYAKPFIRKRIVVRNSNKNI